MRRYDRSMTSTAESRGQALPFAGQVALVTGSTRGIGRAIADRLGLDGASLAIHGRTLDGPGASESDARAQEFLARGGSSHRFAADISQKVEASALVDAVAERFGRLDVLVLNAARAPFKDSPRLLERDLRSLVETNLLGNVFLVQRALPLLEATGGRIVFVSSLGSRFMSPQYPLGPMKAAMEAFVRHWAEEFRGRGVRANAVCAGLVRTDATKTLRRIWPGLDALPDALFVQVEEVADAVAFLAGPGGRGVNGQTLVVDRGFSNTLMREGLGL